MTTDREALVKRLRAIAGKQDSAADGADIGLAANMLTALSAKGGEQPGVVSVPKEPTEEMIEAAYSIDISGDLAVTYRDVYQAMLFAAPRNCVAEISFARQRIREFDNCIQRVAVALDAVCGGVDGDQADIHSTTSVLLKRIAELKTALSAQGGEQMLVPTAFLRGFNTLAHNYSLGAEPPFYYSGRAGDAFKDAYARCAKDLAQLKAILAAQGGGQSDTVPVPREAEQIENIRRAAERGLKLAQKELHSQFIDLFQHILNLQREAAFAAAQEGKK